MKKYKASPALEAFILDRAPPHHPDPDAPNNYEDLRQWWHDTYHARLYDPSSKAASLPVYDGGSRKTIYSSNLVNYAARAWHDSIHTVESLDFSMVDEIKVSNQQVREVRRAGLSEDDAHAIMYDVSGQVLYYYKHKQYVNQQAAFVQACFNDGLIDTVASGVLY